IAFQLQDDYLDAFGDAERFGKQIGGDIIENKKTYLYLKAKELGSKAEIKDLSDLYSLNPKDPGVKIRVVKEIFLNSGAVDKTREAIQEYTTKAFGELKQLSDYPGAEKTLREFGEELMSREV
ncbi:MAG: polyprenyl synthetase family protein, partial [Flavobacteriaceae bacterium]